MCIVCGRLREEDDEPGRYSVMSVIYIVMTTKFQGDYKTFGRLMVESHNSLRDDFEVGHSLIFSTERHFLYNHHLISKYQSFVRSPVQNSTHWWMQPWR